MIQGGVRSEPVNHEEQAHNIAEEQTRQEVAYCHRLKNADQEEKA
jgi:hypothetical protein